MSDNRIKLAVSETRPHIGNTLFAVKLQSNCSQTTCLIKKALERQSELSLALGELSFARLCTDRIIVMLEVISSLTVEINQIVEIRNSYSYAA